MQSFVFAALMVILAHEAGHLAAALTFGIRVKRIGFSWKGVYIVRETGAAKANMLITLAGPLTNLAICIVCWQFWQGFAGLNLIFALANLAPYAGSDGQRALRLARAQATRLA